MRWMPSQVLNIVVNYAHEGIAFCPHDHVRLEVELRRVPGSNQIIINHRCPVCGNCTCEDTGALENARPLAH